MKKNDLVTIQEFAKLCRTTARTIRFYDKLGLLKPVKVDRWNKYRSYSPYQTRDFFRIRLLQNFHIPLKDITRALEHHEEKFLSDRIKSVQEEIAEKQKESQFLKHIKAFLFDDITLENIVKKENIGPFVLFGTKLEMGAYHKLNQDIKRVHEEADKLRIKTYNREMVFYLEPEKYKPKDTRLEVTVITKYRSIPKDIKIPEKFFFRKYPKTPAYIFQYRGPYEFITLVYERLHQLGITELLPVKFEAFDLHLFGPFNSKSEYDYLTKIGFPIKTISSD